MVEKMKPHDQCEGTNYKLCPNPPLGTQHAAKIRAEQTKDHTVAKSVKIAGQFK